MSIKTKLLFIAGFSALAIVVLSIFLYFSFQLFNLAIEKNKTANQISVNIFENNSLLSEYLLYYEDRPRDLWLNKDDSLVATIKTQSSKFSKVVEKEIISNLLSEIGSNQNTFLKLVAFQAENGSNNDTAIEIKKGQQASLVSQILINNQEAVSSAGQLATISLQDYASAQKTIEYILFGFIVVLFLVVAAIVYFIWLSIVKPLITLKTAAERIASLDFTTTTTTTTPANDEIGQLARAFNTMAGKLKDSYKNLSERTQNLENANIAVRNILEDLGTEKKALADTKVKDEALLQSIGEGVVAVDSNGKIILMNHAAEQMLGQSAEQLMGKLLVDAWKVLDEEGNLVSEEKRPIAIALRGKTTTTTTTTTTTGPSYFYTQKDGTAFPVSIVVTPVVANNKIIGAIDIFHDITKEKEAEKLRTDFLSLASHQLRTPLSGTKWLIETMERGITGKIEKKEKEYLDQIYELNERMIQLVSEMLGALRLESETGPVKKDKVLISQLYKDISVSMLAAAKSRKIILRSNLKDHKIATVETNQEILKSILECFISNAINYSEPGQEVALNAEEERGAVVFSVQDKGIGIPEDEQKKIFERFYRASNAKDFKPGGSGLGLNIAKVLAEKIGSEITFESKENKGSTFYLRIPKKIV